MEENVVLDEEAAAVIGRDMRLVAEADGILHARELSLIEAYMGSLGESNPVGFDAINTEDLKITYLRSLVMVALADGKVSVEEHALIVKLCAEIGLKASRVEDAIDEAKKEFMSIFSGLQVFRESMRGVGHDLGLSDNDIDDLWE
jgi:uncharacterized membrane protein YebE (DUF533 family)